MPGSRGNQNARKHGLYARTFVTTHTLTIEQRRAIVDAAIDRIYKRIKTESDTGELVKLVNALALAVTAANTCERTLAITQGKFTPIEDVLDALKAYDPCDD